MKWRQDGNIAYHEKKIVVAVRRYMRSIRYLERLQQLHYRLFTYASSYGHPSLPQPSFEETSGNRKRERSNGDEEHPSNLASAISSSCDGADDTTGANTREGELGNAEVGNEGYDVQSENSGSIEGRIPEDEHFIDDVESSESFTDGPSFMEDLSPMAAQILRSSGLLQRLLGDLAPPLLEEESDSENTLSNRGVNIVSVMIRFRSEWYWKHR